MLFVWRSRDVRRVDRRSKDIADGDNWAGCVAVAGGKITPLEFSAESIREAAAMSRIPAKRPVLHLGGGDQCADTRELAEKRNRRRQ